jgi:LysR family transcriptional regulator, regulator for bpeEF and oprC
MRAMIDLNALRVFERVAALKSFSAAARALDMPKSSVSRTITLLEKELGTRLLQRSTRAVVLTDSGTALRDRSTDILLRVGETVDYVGNLNATPRGMLRVSAGIGFGLNSLSEVLPKFLERYPDVEVALDLTSRVVDLVAGNVDVAIRVGPMRDSDLVATRLGVIPRYLCAAPSYLEKHGTPRTLKELRHHHTVELPGPDGRPRSWTFSKRSGAKVSLELHPRVTVNDVLTIHRLVVNGAGVGCFAGYLCGPDVAARRLVRLFPEWKVPPVDVFIVFPSNRELSPTVRAFVDFLKAASPPGESWQADPLAR